MRSVSRWLAALTASVLMILAATSVAGAQEQTSSPSAENYTHSWSIGPAGSLDPNQPGNRSNLTYDATPGSTITDAVVISNFGNVQLNFRIYATDAVNAEDGQVDLLLGDQQPTDVGSWVQIAQENVTVPPGMELTLPITITVPPDARPGDHVGGIVASSPAPGAAPTAPCSRSTDEPPPDSTCESPDRWSLASTSRTSPCPTPRR